ncbi:Beta-barrel assembly-enhancing protease [termite gut metagenome]|uniref:Beta-barrel assembly-enhancing protease n=1 Tax=termite gut metagenome TaxID=433724 RepID=A0A5J4RL84_9ZZZZ
MKRIKLFLIGACIIAAGTLYAQSTAIPDLSQIKELIKTNPAQASIEINQLLKGKNKKNSELILAIGRVYLDGGNISEAENYLKSAKKVTNKASGVYMLEGDIALIKNDVGLACQAYEQAIYFDPKNRKAYLKYAQVYKNINPTQAIDKLTELKQLDPSSIEVDRALAGVYYSNNRFEEAAEVYSRIINSPEITEDDLISYAFTLFLNHDFEQSLQVSNMGLQRNKLNPAFNRLAMYNYVDLKQFDEGIEAADGFFNHSQNPEFSYLDYLYYGHLLNAVKNYDAAIAQYQKAMELDSTKNLWHEISEAYERIGDYKLAIDAYKKYSDQLSDDMRTLDIHFQFAKLYYGEGTATDSINITKEEKITALETADSIFTIIIIEAPDSYLGAFWRARTNSALDPETTQGLAKPYYETVANLLESKNDVNRYKSPLIECYSYLGYYYLVANMLPESKEYWNKIIRIDPENNTAQRALEGIK